MAFGDVNQIRQISGELTREKINSELRLIQGRLAALEGRTDESQIRDNLEVLGSVVSEGLSTGSADLGAGALVAEVASIDPTVDTDLRPFLTSRADALGFEIPLEIGASPFHFSAYDNFIGLGSTSGNIGTLGWNVTGGTASGGIADLGHPGIVQLSTGAIATPDRITLAPIRSADVKYIAAVIRPMDITNCGVRLGIFNGNLSGSGEIRIGIYFSFLSSASPNWRTVTRNSALNVNTTDIPVVANEWYLLEMVIAEDAVDFYINRQRTFRHITEIPTTVNLTPAFIVESTDAVGSTADIDTFIMLGPAPGAQLWT